MTANPSLSIIVPVRNGGAAFVHCLGALKSSEADDFELIVVDDGSIDSSASLATSHAARLIAIDRRPQTVDRLPLSAGPAVARNLGARTARGDVLVFIDADVAVHRNTIGLVSRAFAADAELTAAFGSYDDQPADRGFLSQFKNLFHHYVHQQARDEASTFWAGCGAIRRSAFLAVGGFDEVTYQRPSIEDIDLGYRLARRGAKIRLFKDWQVTHLKRWTLGGLLRTDIFDRGVPWTRLLWRESRHADTEKRPFRLDLNLQTSNRVSVVCIYLLGASLLGAAFYPVLFTAGPFLAAALVWLNRDLYRFFARHRGWAFAVTALIFHWLYYLYNGVSFALGTLAYLRDGAPRVAPDGSWVAD